MASYRERYGLPSDYPSGAPSHIAFRHLGGTRIKVAAPAAPAAATA